MSQKWMCVNMGMFVNPNNLAFQAALNARIYVDKSGILNYTNSVLGSTDAFICNSRPRRFGKSVTANMLTAYYSKGCDSEEMFSRLEISQAEDFRKHLNQYDVIHWDIQWCMGPANGPEKVVSYISEKTISELREYYPDVLPAENHSLAETLARINTVTGRKFIVIIDEWDVLIRDEAAKEDIQNEYIRFLRGIFKGTEPTKYAVLPPAVRPPVNLRLWSCATATRAASAARASARLLRTSTPPSTRFSPAWMPPTSTPWTPLC